MEAPVGGPAHTRPDDGDAPENVIRVTAAGKERHFIGYAIGLLLEKGVCPVNEKGRRGRARVRAGFLLSPSFSFDSRPPLPPLFPPLSPPQLPHLSASSFFVFFALVH